jgi:hypothetical protein
VTNCNKVIFPRMSVHEGHILYVRFHYATRHGRDAQKNSLQVIALRTQSVKTNQHHQIFF